MWFIIAKAVCLLLAVTYGVSNLMRFARGSVVNGVTMWLMSIGIVGFVTLQWLV